MKQKQWIEGNVVLNRAQGSLRVRNEKGKTSGEDGGVGEL